MRSILLGAALALGAAAASADEVFLTNGNRIEGILSGDAAPEKVVLEVGAGRVVLDAKDVARVRKGRSRLHEYYERREKIKDSREAGDYFLLALWAKEYKCVKFVRPLCEKAVALDPDHEGARRELGHEKVGGKWMTFDEAMAARGMVRFDGRWVTEAEKAILEARRLESRNRQAAAAKERARKREESLWRREEAERQRRQEVERVTTPVPRYLWGMPGVMPMAYSPMLWNPIRAGGLIPAGGILSAYGPCVGFWSRPLTNWYRAGF